MTLLRLSMFHVRRAAESVLILALWALVWGPWFIGVAVLAGWAAR